MVKVYPNSFSFVEKQQLLTAMRGEPIAIACSEECLFVAEEGCMVEVFSLETLEPQGQFRTVSPVVDLVYNTKGDCVVTLERKTNKSHGFCRVYFKWRGASVDRPMRISLLSSLLPPQQGGILSSQGNSAAEIIELPGEANKPVTCLACCHDSGRIGVGMGTTLRIFTLESECQELNRGVSSEEGVSSEHEGRSSSSGSHVSQSSPGSVGVSHTIHLLLDIETSMTLSKLSIYNDYVAFISTHEARVLKLSLLVDPQLQSGPHPFSGKGEGQLSDSSSSSIAREDVSKVSSISPSLDCVTWSPYRVWEDEKSSHSLSGSSSSSLVDISLPMTERNKSHDSRGPSPIIGTLSIPSVCNFTSLKSPDRHPMEVLGPAEYVWGLPVKVKIEEGEGRGHATPTTCRVLTMLYRRFSSRADTDPPSKGRGEDLGLHSVQLLPIVTTDGRSGRELIGISCFLANKSHGYLYDIHLQSHLASSFSFMSPTRAVVCDSTFLHALSAESVETYTNRSLQAAILHMPNTITKSNEWLQKPCPLPSMDLTMVSANQFVSSYCLATSQSHMTVLTKSTEHSQSKSSSSYFSKEPVESTWNIYILQKKDAISMAQQFAELSSSLKGTSPSIYHHLLCEGHHLLRNQVLLNSALSLPQYSQLVDSLQENCYSLAESLCQYSTEKSAVSSAAHYFILSRQPIWTIVSNILDNFPRKPSGPISILMKYLGIVVFEAKFCDESATVDNADLVLSLYLEFKPQVLPQLILQSWIRDLFTPGKALVAVGTFLEDNKLRPHQISLAQLCEAVLHLRLNEEASASMKLKELSDPFLSEWTRNNLEYLMDRSSRLTPFGKLLLATKENCFLSVLYCSLSSGEVEFEQASHLFLHDTHHHHHHHEDPPPPPPKEDMATNLTLKHFLEGIVMDKVKGLPMEALMKALMLLIDILVIRLTAPATPPPSSSTPFHLYGSRHKWLDSFPPFDTLGSAPKPPQVLLQDLMQLQALLCSSHMKIPSDHMITIGRHLEACLVEGMVGEISLKLLAWPHTGKLREAVELILSINPAMTVEYCQTYFPHDLTQWKEVLDMLIENSKEKEEKEKLSPSLPPSDHHHPPPPHFSLYKAALSHVVGLCPPEEFLSLLPSSGSLLFFLPLIERSCKLHLSKELAHHLKSK